MAIDLIVCFLPVHFVAIVLRCHVPVSGEAVLGLAAATGELQLYTLSHSQVRNVASVESQPVFLHMITEYISL